MSKEQALAALDDLRTAIRQRRAPQAVRVAARMVDENLWEHFSEDDGREFPHFGTFVNSVLIEMASE